MFVNLCATTKSSTCQAINKSPISLRKKTIIKNYRRKPRENCIEQQNPIPLAKNSEIYRACISVWLPLLVRQMQMKKKTWLITVWHSSALSSQINMPKKCCFPIFSCYLFVWLFYLSNDMLLNLLLHALICCCWAMLCFQWNSCIFIT